MRYDPPECCPPDAHPPFPDIAPGLPALPRQIAGFADWREAMLRAIKDKKALSDWQADSDGDLGVMLLEFWAYVLDVSAFYDARFSERAYLGTAHDELTAQQVAGLIGYVPRPALVSMVDLALQARGADMANVPPRTGFRSEAFDEEPPHMFETLQSWTIWPQRNQWTLAPYRRDMFDGILRFRPGEGPSRGSVLGIWEGETPLFADIAHAVDTELNDDGHRYQRVKFRSQEDLASLAGIPLSDLTIYNFGLAVNLSLLVDISLRKDKLSETSVSLLLDAPYPQIANNSAAVVQIGKAFHPVTLISNRVEYVALPFSLPESTPPIPTPTTPLSKVEISFPAGVPVDFMNEGVNVKLHVNPRALGQATRAAEQTIGFEDFTASDTDLRLKHPVPPLPDGAPEGGTVIAQGAQDRGAKLAGRVVQGDDDSWTFQTDLDSPGYDDTLSAPVKIFGNIVSAARGETVLSETLGSGDASQTFQFFTLKKKPLSWIMAEGPSLGRKPQIDVMIDGIFWTWVETMYGQAADARIFTVEMEPDGTAHVQFGDGVNGAILPTGVDNVRASYRFGAGAAKPPAGAINQIARTSKRLSRVINPLSPYGGADAETAAQMQDNASDFTLALDRAVSLSDYLAMARAFSGVTNCSAAEKWSAEKLQDIIEIALISDAGDPSDALKSYLEARSVPGTIIDVALAHKETVSSCVISLEISSDYEPEAVRLISQNALFADKTGLLSFARIPIGAPVFRSHIIAALHAVPGVIAVNSVMIDGAPMPAAMVPEASTYFDFISHGEVL